MSLNIQSIIDEYCKIINTKYLIPLSNADIIEFTFKGSNLPHLLGLQYFVDISIFEKYSNGTVNASQIFKSLRDKTIDINKIYSSKYFDQVYQDKIKHFNVNKLLCPIQIIESNSTLIKDYESKLEKVEYIFWNYISSNNGYGHLGIGFTTDNGINFPNTFFFRQNNQYIVNQKEVYPLSHFIKKPNKTIKFKIYWRNVRESMVKTSHYKYLKKYETEYNYRVNDLTNESISRTDNHELIKHYELLRLDEVKKVYEPYLDEAAKWPNNIKRYLIGEYLVRIIPSKHTTYFSIDIFPRTAKALNVIYIFNALIPL